jgi:hypothetical protein
MFTIKYPKKVYEDYAVKNNGQFIEDNGIFFVCQKGHRWPATRKVIGRNTWCFKCARTQPVDSNYYQQIASDHGGKYLQDLPGRKGIFECKVHGQFIARRDHVSRGSWCEKCSNRARKDISEYRKFAKEHGGILLSEVIGSARSFISFRCKKGHEFKRLVMKSTWCPHCSNNYISQNKVKRILEALFGKPFPTIKPEWLRMPNGNKLELDGYCEELKIAFEYQGRQHDDFVPHWHKTVERFELQRSHDAIKLQRCKENGVKLIIIKERDKIYPAIGREIVNLSLKKYISSQETYALCSSLPL